MFPDWRDYRRLAQNSLENCKAQVGENLDVILGNYRTWKASNSCRYALVLSIYVRHLLYGLNFLCKSSVPKQMTNNVTFLLCYFHKYIQSNNTFSSLVTGVQCLPQGSHHPGQCQSCVQPGLQPVSVPWHSWTCHTTGSCKVRKPHFAFHKL